MKFRSFTALFIAASVAAVIGSSCDEDTVSEIGTSLIGDNVEIVIDSSFTASGNTVMVQAVRPKSTIQLLGEITIPAYGTLRSDIVAQFLPSTMLDTAQFSYKNVDSLMLNLRYISGNFLGDSLAPMGYTVYPLTKLLPTNLSTDFNPDGYYDTTPIAERIYSASTLNMASGVQNATTREIDVKLPQSLGQRLFKAFEDNPSDYANGQIFSEKVFPGVYLKSSFGSGRLTRISVCAMSAFLRKITFDGTEKPDTVDGEHLYYLTTPEVVSNSNLTYTMADELKQRVADGQTLMVAPAGCEIEFTFPIKEIIDSFSKHSDKLSVINSLTMSIPVDSIANGMGVTPPPYALMVLKKDRDAFFAQNKLPDKKTSFYTTYSSGAYSFTGLREYMLTMMDKEEITEDDFTFSLVPVQVTFESLAGSNSYYSYYYGSSYQTQTESDMQPYVYGPVMGQVRFDKAKIKLTYSLRTQN